MGWSEDEVTAAVRAYFDLLADEQSGRVVNKAAIYRELASKFPRSPKSFELKFQNISAILFEQRLPYCNGLKPKHNYQRLLKLLVLDHIDRTPLPAVEPHEILFSKLRALGTIKVSGTGSGRFGRALEDALGISANSSKDADFMGIELKTKHGNSLQTLFSRIPSRYVQHDGKAAFFEAHCSHDEKRNRRALYTSFTSKPDTLGFSLRVNGHRVEALRRGEVVFEYDAERIEEALLSKHSQTAYISLSSQRGGSGEECAVQSVTYCKWPSILRFLMLITSGDIFLDLTLSESGKRIRDHGFLWRIRQESIDQLYLSTESVDPASV